MKYTFNPLKCHCLCVQDTGIKKSQKQFTILFDKQFVLGFKIPQRVILAIMLHLALQNAYCIRVALNIAIVEMVEQVQRNQSDHACPQYEPITVEREGAKFPWPQRVKAEVLYAFFVGYSLTCLPGGWLADKFGGRHVLGMSILLSSITNAVFPYFTHKGGYVAAVVLRGITGIVQGPILPAISSFVSTWMPPSERTVLGGISYGGSNLGTVVSNALTGVLIHFFNGWVAVFYFWSISSLAYMIGHLLLVFSFPSTHPFIDEEELEYLTKNITTTKRNLRTPWKAILTNVPYWANIAGQFGHNYIFYMMVTWLPTYMKEILQYDITSNGLFSALPFFALWASSLILSCAANYYVNVKNYLSPYAYSRVFGTLSNIICAAFMLGAVYVGCNRELCITLYITGMIVKAFYYTTFPVNINELSKNYGGIMFGMCNGISGSSAILGSVLVGYLTQNNKLSEWRLVFWITFGIEVFTSVIYILWSSAERQLFDFEGQEEPE